ncbi:MAG: hypothetical protein KAI81_03480 [Candidatus Marinimicrobia bacterium]|nr:hypothetical protein [Candidatus Neomarinimicrobiota bacterium]
MKTQKHILPALMLIMALYIPGNADVLTVNNISNTGAQYSTLQAAHDAASTGDTLSIGASLTYGDLTMTKRLVIMGPGYFLGENPETQANISSAGVNTITINSGSEGTLITGLRIKYYMTINTDNITIQKNLFYSAYSAYLLTIAANVSNIIIKQNYFYSTYGYKKCVDIKTNSSADISNNYMGGEGTTYTSGTVLSTNSSTVTFENNVIDGSLMMNEASVSIQNNIMIKGTISGVIGSMYNNIANEGQFGSDNGNLTADMADVFKNTGSTDGQWKLSDTSPALGAGVDDVDCGMFGGITPYILSGIPGPLPAIYYLKSTGEGSESTGLQIRLKSKVRD